MEVDNSDILGGPILKNSRGNQSSWFSASTIVLTVLGLLGLYIAGVQVWARVLVWKEKSYKLAMRRRHGIPDNDHRPFNVAYAAVVLARQEQEAAARKAMLQRPPAPPQSEPEPVVRQRQGVHREQSSAALMNVPGRFDFPSDSGYSTGTSRANGYPTKPFSDRLNFEDRYNPAPATHVNESIYSQSSGGRSRRASHKSIVNGDSRKRAYTADEDVDPNDVKKSKHEHGERDVEEVVVPRRGYKRGASQEEEDDDEAYESKRGREKRLRKVSLEKSPQYDSEMEIYAEEDEDNVPEMTALVRGKKRDRAEAGSTFGGDEEDSSHEAEVDDQKSHRHRKRRNRRKSEGVPSRGTKRDRDAEEEASDIDSDEAQVKASRKKRGKKLSPKVEVDDASMDDSPTPSVASGRVKRRIGEEWESNGVKFKIGPNGQRLRQTLVKKERQKFPMPMDSQHPDRQVNLEVCVETWLTEEEYREAKENHRLAWQDASKSPSEPATPATIEIPPPSPRKGGKDLLWQSTATGLPTPQVSPPSTPAKQNGFRQSMIGNGVTPITPFQPGHASSKRIASAPRHSFPSYGSPGLANSINGKPQLTRWEKEEMEANAIMKLRRKKDEETKKLQEEQEKAEKEKKAKEAAASVPKLPAITITKPEETKPAEAKPTPSLFGPPTTCTQPTKPSLFGPTPTATSGDAKAPGTSIAPAAAPSKPAESPFGFGPKPAEKPSPSPLFPSLAGSSAPAVAPASQGGSGLKFSFPTSAPTANAPKPEEKKDANQGSGLKFSFPTSAPIASAPKLEEKEAAPSTSQNPGSSLFSRMGPQPTSMPGPTPSASTGNSSPFSFAKTTTEAPKPASPFFNSASTIMPAATTSAAEPPKFNFGFNPAPPAAPTSSSSLSGALGNEPKPAAAPSPSFGFPKLDAPTQQATGSATSGSIFGTPAGSGTSTGPFNFGGGPSFGNKTEQKAPEADKAPAAPATPAKSPFNFAPSTSTNGSSATTNSSTTKPTFSFGATAPSGPTAFSNSSSTPSTNNASQPAFGGGFSMPSSNTATSAAAPAKFSFGTPSTTSTATEAPKSFGSTTSATSQDSKPASTFGSTTMNGSATNGEAPKPLFGGFGSNTSAPSPFSSNGAFGGSTGAFGAPKAGEAAKTPATFGFGASSTTGAQQPSLSFGTPSAANGSSNTFGFGDATKSTTQPTTTSLFGSSTTNGTASSFSSFGAAAGGSPFSFGKTPSTSGDSK